MLRADQRPHIHSTPLTPPLTRTLKHTAGSEDDHDHDDGEGDGDGDDHDGDEHDDDNFVRSHKNLVIKQVLEMTQNEIRLEIGINLLLFQISLCSRTKRSQAHLLM